MRKEITVAQLDIDIKKFEAKALRLKKKIEGLKTSLKTLKKDTGVTTKEYVKQETELKRLSGQYNLATKNINLMKNSMDKTAVATIRSKNSISKLGNSIRTAFSRFVGFTIISTAIFGFVRGVRDAIKRIREFGKVMTNISAILNIPRKQIGDLETEIKRVAATSIKTSTEVAHLAETLIVLGKSKDEVIKLIRPINNLSIALQSSSQDAGELLIKTMNAFGVGIEQAGKYADIIAKMRTSTALDFEKIKDALGFLAPTAKAAGVTFEETGAILGVLVDNGIKASRAGRLMSSSFLRLSKKGKTLGNALEEVRKAQESNISNTKLLKISTDLFGVRSAALGLILANNKQKLKDLNEEFKNSQGTLGRLTRIQLKSLDAKLEILDSTWEKFILGVQNGDGWLGQLSKTLVVFATDVLKAISPTESLTTQFKELKREIENTDSKIDPLLEQYKKLKDITTPNEEEQKKLKQVIIDIGNVIPFAITKFDDYGNAIAISTTKVEEARKAQQLYLQFKNRDAIDEVTNTIKVQELQLRRLNSQYRLNKDGVLEYNLVQKEGAKVIVDKWIVANEELINSFRNGRNDIKLEIDNNKILLETLSGVSKKTEDLTGKQKKQNELIKEATINSVLSMDATLKRVDLEKKSQTELNDLENKLSLEREKRLKQEAKYTEFKKHQSAERVIDLKKGLDKELAIIDEQFRQKLAKVKKGSIEEKILLEQEADAKIAKSKEFEIKADEQLQKLKNEIRLKNAENQEQRRLEKEQIDFENKQVEIENSLLSDTDKYEQLEALRIAHENRVQGIIEESSSKKARLLLRYQKIEERTQKKIASANISIVRSASRILESIFGDNLILKFASVVADAVASIAKIKVSAATARATNMAAAVSVGFPQNIPLIKAAGTQNKALTVQSKIQQGLVIASGVFNLGKSLLKGKGKYTGGVIDDGTPIPKQMRNIGGDDVLIQAKKGEVVLNEEQQERAGGGAFFNSIGVPGFAGGGLVGDSTINNITNSKIDVNEFADIIAQKINDIKVVAVVDDITDAQFKQTEIIDGANI